jgi:hypothetical protein
MSALLIAEGIRRVQPGPIVVIDTESLRALKHADGNPDRFIHVPFGDPFGPLDYIEAFKHAIKHQPSTIIVDSMSHEWEGPGGVLAQQAATVKAKGDSHKMSAWIEPKADHTAMKHFILQQRCNWIFCFRAKEKTGVAGNKPVDLGWQPLGAEDLIYEMDLCALLYPGVDGRPEWSSRSKILTEQAVMKLPGWFRALFDGKPQFNPEIGEQLARWAAGGDISAPSVTATSSRTTSPAPAHPLVARYASCPDRSAWDALEVERGKLWKAASDADKLALKAASNAAMARIETSKPGDPSPEEQAEIARQEAQLNKERP